MAEDPADGVRQLYLLDGAGRREPKRLTDLRDGVRTAGAVSRNGRWVAAVAGSGGLTALVVVDLDAVSDRAGTALLAKADGDREHGH